MTTKHIFVEDVTDWNISKIDFAMQFARALGADAATAWSDDNLIMKVEI